MQMPEERLVAAQQSYFEIFKLMPPFPAGVSDARIVEVLERAVKEGKPIPEDFDWWDYLPPGAVA